MIIRNSYGSDYQDGGRFYIKYSDFALLYSCVAFVDASNREAILLEQSKRRRAEAKAKGYWNGERENQNLTRYEASLISMRVASRTSDDGIWNGERPDTSVTRYEAVLMIERATDRRFPFEIKNPHNNITRGEMAELSVRI